MDKEFVVFFLQIVGIRFHPGNVGLRERELGVIDGELEFAYEVAEKAVRLLRDRGRLE